jgi:hypothetical protein
MEGGEDGVMPEHSGTCCAHHFAYFLTLFARVTVDRTFGAGWFFVLEPTSGQAGQGVFLECGAVRTKFCGVSVPGGAVDLYHGFEGATFPVESVVLAAHRFVVLLWHG